MTHNLVINFAPVLSLVHSYTLTHLAIITAATASTAADDGHAPHAGQPLGEGNEGNAVDVLPSTQGLDSHSVIETAKKSETEELMLPFTERPRTPEPKLVGDDNNEDEGTSADILTVTQVPPSTAGSIRESEADHETLHEALLEVEEELEEQETKENLAACAEVMDRRDAQKEEEGKNGDNKSSPVKDREAEEKPLVNGNGVTGHEKENGVDNSSSHPSPGGQVSGPPPARRLSSSVSLPGSGSSHSSSKRSVVPVNGVKKLPGSTSSGKTMSTRKSSSASIHKDLPVH